jgi:hypothetical protein
MASPIVCHAHRGRLTFAAVRYLSWPIFGRNSERNLGGAASRFQFPLGGLSREKELLDRHHGRRRLAVSGIVRRPCPSSCWLACGTAAPDGRYRITASPIDTCRSSQRRASLRDRDSYVSVRRAGAAGVGGSRADRARASAGKIPPALPMCFPIAILGNREGPTFQ